MSENLNKLYPYLRVLEDLSSDKTMDVYDTGKVFTLSSKVTITLPDPSGDNMAGWYARFIYTEASGGATGGVFKARITSSAAAADIVNLNFAGDGGNAVTNTASQTVDFVSGAHGNTSHAMPGDFVDILCDGNTHYAYGFCTGTLGVTGSS